MRAERLTAEPVHERREERRVVAANQHPHLILIDLQIRFEKASHRMDNSIPTDDTRYAVVRIERIRSH